MDAKFADVNDLDYIINYLKNIEDLKKRSLPTNRIITSNLSYVERVSWGAFLKNSILKFTPAVLLHTYRF